MVRSSILNIKGTKILFNNFVEAISNILQWQPIIHSLSGSKCVLMIDKYKAKRMNVQGVESLEEIRKRNRNRIVMFHLNINFSRNMFDSLIEQITGNAEIFMILETTIVVFRGGSS